MAVAAEAELNIDPSLERARELAAEGNAIPIRLSFVDDCETPVSAFLKLRGEGPCFLLESAEQGRLGRYSFLGFNPRAVLRWSNGRLEAWAGERLSGEPASEVEAPDPYLAVSDYIGGFKVPPVEDLPAFAGGAVGFFGYDLVRTIEPLGEPNPDPIGLPDMALMVSDLLVVFDHMRHELTLMSYAFVEGEDDLEAAYARAAGAIVAARDRLRGPVPRSPVMREPGEAPAFESNMSREQFEDNVRRIVEYVFAGDAFQVVPSQRFSAPSPVEAFSIYRGLRAINPSPYMYFLDFGDFQVAGASPEPLLTVTGRSVSTKPIAGTRPRGATPEEDRRIEGELLADEKERAEHVMLVDLGRNDLGRVCEYGSVKVDELMAIEAYSHVMHIVSSVSGTLADGVAAMDALRASLPAGTLSGAPKIRAMQIIDSVESTGRGPYGGAVGYLSFTGDLDTCIYIRSAFVKDGRMYTQAGGGIVADSEAGYEVRETEAKANAIFEAAALACRQPDWA